MLSSADRFIRAAEKANKTSLTKWSSDPVAAADNYCRAGKTYKMAKKYPEALRAFDQAATCYMTAGALSHAARMMEESVYVSRDCGDTKGVHDLAARGAMLFRQHGYPESAKLLLKKSAKILDSLDPLRAASLCEKAAETVMVEDRPKEAGEYMAKAGRLLVKGGDLEGALLKLDRSISLLQQSGWFTTAGRSVVGMVLIHLATGDPVAASKAFQKWGGYCDPDQTFACYQMVNGFVDSDMDKAKVGLNHHCLQNLDAEYQRLAKSIQLPMEGQNESGGIEAAAKAFGEKRMAQMAREENTKRKR